MAVKTSRRTRRFDSLEQEVFLSLWRSYDRLRIVEDELFTQFEMTSQQYNILRLLEAELPDGVPTLQLAARLISRAPDITRMLDKLEERGLIARHRLAENRRVVEVRLTESGQRVLEQIAEPLQDCHVRQLGHLSASALKQLRDLLHSVRAPHEAADSPWK